MLTKRAHILFEENTWKKLSLLAKKERVSVGELVRKAIHVTFFSKSRKNEALAAYKSIVRNRKKFKSIDYRSLIYDGRRF